MLVIISISVLQNFNYPSASCVTIHVMIVRHDVRMQFRQWLYILLLILAVFGLNWLWQTYLPSFGIWTDSILRSIVLLGGACLIAYKAQLSPELNDQINHLKKKIINLKS